MSTILLALTLALLPVRGQVTDHFPWLEISIGADSASPSCPAIAPVDEPHPQVDPATVDEAERVSCSSEDGTMTCICDNRCCRWNGVCKCDSDCD